jgi:hypothetical protein
LVKQHHLCEQCESLFNVGGSWNNIFNLFLFFRTFALVVRISLDVEIDKFSDFFNLGLEGIFATHSFLLGVCGLNFAFFD